MIVWKFCGGCGKINNHERRISHEEITADYKTSPHIAYSLSFGAYSIFNPPDTSKSAAGFY
jgi:hypothetical protein